MTKSAQCFDDSLKHQFDKSAEQTILLDSLVGLIDDIEGWAEWHADHDADINDPSPEDMHAHCNGLILQACDKARQILANENNEALQKQERN